MDQAHEHQHVRARDCERLHTPGHACERLRTRASSCARLHTTARTCTDLRTLAHTFTLVHLWDDNALSSGSPSRICAGEKYLKLQKCLWR